MFIYQKYRKSSMQKLLWSIFLVLFLVPVAYAVPVGIINATGCGFSSGSPLTCGATTMVSCNVQDLFGGAQVINGVTFRVNGLDYQASVSSGNTVSGVWSAALGQTTTTGANSLSINQITVRESTGTHTCVLAPQQGSVNQSAGCYMSANIINVLVNCTCAFTTQRTCALNGTLTVNYVASSGCAQTGQTSYSTTGTCDYCKEVLGADTKWIPTYGSCVVNTNATGFDALLPQELTGLATKRYVAAPGDVCFASGAAGSQIKPVDDGIAVICRQDYWNTAGKDSAGNSEALETHMVNAPFTNRQVSIVPSVGVDGVQLHPLVFDWGRQGSSGILVPTTAGFTVYDPSLTTIRSSVVTGFSDWEGELGTIGFNDYDHSGNTHGYTVTNTTGVAGIAFNGTSNTDYFVAYWNNGGTFVPQCTTNLGATTAGGAGVACDGVTCYFLDNQMTLHAYDTSSCTETTQNLAVVAASGYAGNVPILVSLKNSLSLGSTDTINTVAVLGMNAAFAPTIYACNVALGACTSEPINPTSFSMENASKLMAEVPVVASNTVKLHFTSTDSTGLNTRVWATLLHGSAFFGALPGNLSLTNLQDTVLTSAGGGVSSCISDPVSAKCPGSLNGVAVASYWSTGAISFVPSATKPTLNEQLDNVISAASPLNPYAAVQNNANTGLVSCASSLCTMSSQFTTRSSATLYASNGGTTWSTVAYPVSFSFDTNNDGLLAMGAASANSYFLFGHFNNSLNLFDRFEVWKYSVPLGTWTSLQNISAYTGARMFANPSSATVGRYMTCTVTGCYVTSQYSSISGAVNEFAYNYPYTTYGALYIDATTDAVSVHVPGGVITGSQNANASPVYGYAKSSSADYYDVYNPTIAKMQILRYTSPSSPTVLDTTQDSGQMDVGLTRIGTGDTVYWGKISDTLSANCTVVNTTGVVWSSSLETFSNTSGPTSTTYACPWQLKHSVSGSAAVNDASFIVTSVGSGNPGNPGHAIVALDKNGIPFLSYVDKIPMGATDVNSFAFGLVILSAKGVYHPILGHVGNIGPGSGDWRATNVGGNAPCYPADDVTANACRPLALPVGASDQFPQLDADNTAMAYAMTDNAPVSYIRAIMEIGNQSAQTFAGNYVDLSCFQTSGADASMTKISDATVNIGYCPKRLSAMERDASGVDAIAMPSGVFSLNDGVMLNALNGDTTTTVESLDTSSDTYGDYITLTGTVLQDLLSNQTNVAYGGTLSAYNLSCKALSDGSVAAAVSEAKSPHPLNTIFSGTLSSGAGGGPVVATAQSGDGVFNFGVQQAGAYMVSASMTDTVTGNSYASIATCVAQGVGPIAQPAPPATACSIDPEGVFTFIDAMSVHHWTLSGASQEPQKNGQYITVVANSGFRMDHAVTCSAAKFIVDINVSSSAASSWRLDVVDANANVIAYVSVHDGSLYVSNGASELKIMPMNTAFRDIALAIDFSQGSSSVSVDGVQVTDGQALEASNPGNIAFISYKSSAGAQPIVWIKTASGTSAQKSLPPGDIALSRCVDVSDRNFTAQPVGGGANATLARLTSTLFPNIDAYCKTLPGHANGAPCTYGDLQNAITRNSVCYHEAYMYCVYKTYGAVDPNSNAQLQTKLNNLGTSGLSGATVCTAALGGQVGVSGFAVPIIGTIWALFTSTVTGTLVLIILVFILVISLAVWARRR